MHHASNTVLVVDEDQKVLDASVRLLGRNYEVHTCGTAEEALAWLKENPHVAVVLSCVNLPGMDGAVFLHQAEKLSPFSARILLTAEKSIEVLKQGVNEARIFMYLSKPCPGGELVTAVGSGVSYHARLVDERAMLERTISGAVRMLIEMLSLFHGDAFRRTDVMRPQALTIAKALGLTKTWELEMAVMFSPLGEALLPKDILARHRAARSLTPQQRDILAAAPAQSRDLIKNIPQLERIADLLYLSGKGFDGSGFPENGPAGSDIPLVSRILKILTDLWYASPEGGVDAAAFNALAINGKQYDPKLLEIARRELLDETDTVGEPKAEEHLSCTIRMLKPGDVLLDDVLSEASHELILSRGHQLTETTIRRLVQFDQTAGVRQPVRVVRKPVYLDVDMLEIA